MGVCQNISRAKGTIRANAKEKNKNYINSEIASKFSQTSYYSKNQTTRSNLNLSSSSTKAQILPTSNPHTFEMPAILGEIEIPILVERNEKILIKINNDENNKNNCWGPKCDFFPTHTRISNDKQ